MNDEMEADIEDYYEDELKDKLTKLYDTMEGKA